MAMNNYRAPTNGGELLSFLGIVQLFSRRIGCAKDRRAPLYDMLNVTTWNEKNHKSQIVHVFGWQ